MRQINENKNVESLAKISSSNIRSNGECLTFAEQKNKLESGLFPTEGCKWLARTEVSLPERGATR